MQIPSKTAKHRKRHTSKWFRVGSMWLNTDSRGRVEQLLKDLGPLPLQMFKIKQKRIRRNQTAQKRSVENTIRL